MISGRFSPPFGTKNAPKSPLKAIPKIDAKIDRFLLIFGSLLDLLGASWGLFFAQKAMVPGGETCFFSFWLFLAVLFCLRGRFWSPKSIHAWFCQKNHRNSPVFTWKIINFRHFHDFVDIAWFFPIRQRERERERERRERESLRIALKLSSWILWNQGVGGIREAFTIRPPPAGRRRARSCLPYKAVKRVFSSHRVSRRGNREKPQNTHQNSLPKSLPNSSPKSSQNASQIRPESVPKAVFGRLFGRSVFRSAFYPKNTAQRRFSVHSGPPKSF